MIVEFKADLVLPRTQTLCAFHHNFHSVWLIKKNGLECHTSKESSWPWQSLSSRIVQQSRQDKEQFSKMSTKDWSYSSLSSVGSITQEKAIQTSRIASFISCLVAEPFTWQWPESYLLQGVFTFDTLKVQFFFPIVSVFPSPFPTPHELKPKAWL